MVNTRNLGNATTHKKKKKLFLKAEESESTNLLKMQFMGENLNKTGGLDLDGIIPFLHGRHFFTHCTQAVLQQYQRSVTGLISTCSTPYINYSFK